MVEKLQRRESLGWLVAVLAEQMKNELDSRLKKHGLNIGFWPTLFALWEEEGVTQAELSKRCMTANYTTTRVLDRMTELGLLERRADPESRRSFRIYLTEKGRSLEASLAGEARSVNRQILGKLSEPEADQLIALLHKII